MKTEHAIEGIINSKINLEIQTKICLGKIFPTASLGTIVRVLILNIKKEQGDLHNTLRDIKNSASRRKYRIEMKFNTRINKSERFT